MPTISFELSAEGFAKIAERCELLGITQKEYADWMYTMGQWVLDRSEEGRVIGAIDPQSGNYREFSAPLLDKFLEAHREMKSILKPPSSSNENTA